MKPATLSSFVYVDGFLKATTTYGRECYRSWVLDSGAYSALTSGVKIDLNEFADKIAEVVGSSNPPKVVFSLDVIGDPEKTAKNADKLKDMGLDVVPTFHLGSPWHYLEALGKHYEKIALGGMVARGEGGHGSRLDFSARDRFLGQCFSRVWPIWIHGFGITDPRLMYNYPFASVDSITWLYRVGRYGQIQGYKNLPVVKSSKDKHGHDAAIRVSLRQFLHLEDDVRRRPIAQALKKVTDDPFDLCLGVSGDELRYFQCL